MGRQGHRNGRLDGAQGLRPHTKVPEAAWQQLGSQSVIFPFHVQCAVACFAWEQRDERVDDAQHRTPAAMEHDSPPPIIRCSTSRVFIRRDIERVSFRDALTNLEEVVYNLWVTTRDAGDATPRACTEPWPRRTAGATAISLARWWRATLSASQVRRVTLSTRKLSSPSWLLVYGLRALRGEFHTSAPCNVS